MRKKRLIYNTVSGVLNQAIMLVCNFILPRLILVYYGSGVNGLITSITQFLGFIALTEMGITAVVQSSLYGPLVRNDVDEISRIVKSSNRFFNKIGGLLFVYIIALCGFYPAIVKDYSYGFVIPLVISISINSIAQYYFGMTNLLLLYADQKSYIPLCLNSISIIANTLISLILMRLGATIQIVKFAASIVLLIKPIGMMVYVKHHYKINKNIVLEGEPIKQKWNGIAQHLASFILSHTDVMVLTLFSSLTNVSIYNVYYMVVAGIRQIITTATIGIEALFGNLYAEHNPKLISVFSAYEWFVHTAVSLIFTVAAILICPFVSVYTAGVNDANYIYPLFSVLLVAAYGLYSVRLPYNSMVISAGHFKQTQTSAIVEAGVNVLLSVVLVRKFGLVGVSVGTVIAMTYRTIYLAYYLSNNILVRSIKFFIKHIVIDALSVLIIWVSTRWISIDVSTYASWFLKAIQVFGIAFIEVTIINLVFFRKEIMITFSLIKKKV